KPLPEGVRYATSLENAGGFEIVLIASDRLLPELENAVVYRPKSLVLGVGCDRGTPLELIERGIDSLLDRHGLSRKCVKEVATIDKKADEPALLALCEKRRWPLCVFRAEE